MPDLLSGRGILVSEVFANRTGLTVGDRFHAQIAGTLFDLPIVGIFRDYRTQGGAALYSIEAFERMTGDRAWSGVRIFFRDRDADIDAAAARLRDDILRRFAERYGIGAILGRDLRGEIMRIFDETFAITTVLLLIALIVAALGITTTLTVLVLERKRQLNTLLAIGAGIRQIRRMIVWEAILMVGIGEIIGLACGFILSYILVFVINRQSFGWTFVYNVDWMALLPALPLILVTALLASLPAIRMVFRFSPALALRE
jgi:putative ABC transport system permease protein